MTLPVTVALAAAMALMLVALATRVSMLRMRHKVPWGDGGVTELQRAIRLHGNTAEHAPMFVLLALVYELASGTGMLLGVAAAVFVLGRILFAAALIGRGLHRFRMAGALLTYLMQALLAVALLVSLVGGVT